MPTSEFSTKQPEPYDENGEDICAHAWQQFESRFPTENDCWGELCARLEANGQAKCSYCGSKDLDKFSQARVRKCKTCNKKTWLTAGTFFNRIRLARPWLAAIWLMEHGVVISSLKLRALVGIAQSSALHILKKVATVIQSHFGENAADFQSADFHAVFCKRSRLTPAREHPVKEQEAMENYLQTNLHSHLEVDRTNPIKSEPGQTTLPDIEFLIEPLTEETTIENLLKGREKEVYRHLSKEPILFDALCGLTKMSVSELSSTLTMLELAGAIERLPGDQYVRYICKQIGKKYFGGTTSQSAKAVSDFINFVRARFHGISRKYLQLYLALHWCSVARTQWCNSSLLKACLEFGPISYNQILSYVSPLIVQGSPQEI